MSSFPIHSIASAPQKSVAALEQLHAAFGTIPAIAGVIAASPVLLNGFVAVFANVHSGSLSEAEIQTLLLTNAVTNRCEWAVAFHTGLALQQGVPQAEVDALRAGRSPDDARRHALSTLARTLIETRGHLQPAALQAFLDAGFDSAQVLEVIAVVAASTITNYTGSVARPPLAAPFDAYAWHAPV
ncbi:carboxymuconolactone decarboxylase family protein [Burkholderia plantarii]|uniref:carboxymuconolactone decarboxylase family protein n=1 Tax=Burkholderia plantarii TaxID=41899 RepID=UPI0018DE278F|nr:carboxymuconolactone decarboxylase family protein [Burkholderia plantarii]MBI0331055.1 carboxymuconolactone decarboxylase family protein [Burkholderia plantarii]